MKFLHTADWHAGRNLRGVDRTPEVREVLQEIAALATEEMVDLIVVAGDLYDSKTPGPAADAAVYEFFLTTARAGIPSVVIAGNHDSPARLDASGELLRLAKTHVFGDFKPAGQGGTITLELAGEEVQVAALPFVSERRLVRMVDLLGGDPGAWRQRYQEGMRKLVGNLTQPFSADTVNLLVMHTTMNGATLANSEYSFHCSEAYSLSPDIFPDSCNYVALGHIHKPQTIQDFPAYAARYSGSVLQLDFGEQGDRKYVYILEAKPGQPTEVLKEHELKGGKRLKRIKLGFDALERQTPELAAFDGWLKLVVSLERPKPGLKDRLKAHLPNLLAVELELPGEEGTEAQGVDLERMTLLDAYQQFYVQRGQELPENLTSAFRELYEATEPEAA